MTWPDGIAAAIGIATIALLEINQRNKRSTTKTPPRTEAPHGRQHPHQRPQDQPGKADR